MKFSSLIPVVLIAAVVTQGCVSSKKYKDLQASYDQLKEKSKDLNQKYQSGQQDLSGSASRVKSLEEQIASEKAN